MDCALDCACCPLASDEQAKLSLEAPTDDVAGFVARIACRVRAALTLLVESCDYALRFNRKAADFPVELAELKKAGLTGNDLRGLLYAGVLEQVPCPQARSAAGGKEQRAPLLPLPETACYILTAKGLSLSRHVLATTPAACTAAQAVPPPSESSGNGHLGNGHTAASSQPMWDADRQELYLGSTLVKRFKVPAVNQVRILSAFEEEGWPPRVDDPLPTTPGVEPKRRLHHTINSLNGSQLRPLIHFMGDGTGTGIRWEPREESRSQVLNGHSQNDVSQNGHHQNGHLLNGVSQNGLATVLARFDADK